MRISSGEFAALAFRLGCALLLFTWFFCWAAWGQAPTASPVCVSCDQPIFQGTVWQHPRGLLCENCAKIEQRCWVCALPVIKPDVKTGDGRYLCRFDGPTAVLELREAEELFAQTRLEVERVTANDLVLTTPKVTIALFDIDYWNKTATGPVPEAERRMGMSRSRPRAGGGYDHSVLLLSGLPRVQLMSTCAHELTHLWVNENLAKDRKLDPDTLEAVCELIAYKLMEHMKSAPEMERILKNAYTHGKINELLKADQNWGLYRILEWVRTGRGAEFDPNPGEAPKPSAAPAWKVVAVPKPVATALKLRGISGPASRRTAMINDRNFFQGDEKEITLKDKTLVVRCLDVLADSVTIQVEGQTNRVTLRLAE